VHHKIKDLANVAVAVRKTYGNIIGRNATNERAPGRFFVRSPVQRTRGLPLPIEYEFARELGFRLIYTASRQNFANGCPRPPHSSPNFGRYLMERHDRICDCYGAKQPNERRVARRGGRPERPMSGR
jgi:hypothetical protein